MRVGGHEAMLMESQAITIADIRVPVKRKKTLDPARVDALAESVLEEGQKMPILVRPDGEHFVLVEGLHRLEALKALGEETIMASVVHPRPK